MRIRPLPTPARWTALVPLCVGLVTSPGRAAAQVYRVAELNTEQIRALDRQKTVVLLPGGILEEHGPYLPSFSDGFQNEHLTGSLASAIAARPGWSALVFPTIPLGSGGANEIGQKYAFPGTYAVRPTTVRAVFMDLASELGEQGFRWIFVIHGHGSPDHNRALDEAGDFFRDTYGGHMVHLVGLLLGGAEGDSVVRAVAGPQAVAENGFTVHAGLVEHARIRYLRPDLVPEGVARAKSVTGANLADLMSLAAASDWPGYFGSPRLASAELGERESRAQVGLYVAAALAILDGRDEREIPRYADFMYTLPDIKVIMGRSLEHHSRRERQQQDWLSKRGNR